MPAPSRMLISLLTTLLLLTPSLLADKSKCKVCKDMTKHFQEHFDKTKGQNYGGGNTAWEERSLGRGTYATSETRLVEILEKTAKKCDYKCGSLLEDQEEYLEEWFKERQDKTDLFEELCVDHLKRCCLENRWGSDCAECPGGVEEPCSGHGKCRGEGERENKAEKNMGTCSCNPGYKGTVCDQCNTRYVKVGETCEECSKLCKSQNCTAPGPAGCVECRMGYEMVEGTGCTDINECEKEGMGCGDPLEDCVNSAGTYECICKADYKRVDGKCQLEDLYASEDEEDDPVEVDETKEGSETEAKEDDTAISEEKDDDDYTEVEDSEDTKTPKDSISSEDEAESVEETKSRDEL